MSVQQLTPFELKAKMQQDSKLTLLDVREPQEFAYARIEGSVLIPLSQLSSNIDAMVKQHVVVVICHHGVRSQQAADYLHHQGMENVFNLQGGIDAWSRECDSKVPRY